MLFFSYFNFNSIRFVIAVVVHCFFGCVCLVVVVVVAAAALHMCMQRVLLGSPTRLLRVCTCVAHQKKYRIRVYILLKSFFFISLFFFFLFFFTLKSVANEWIHMIWAVNIYHIHIARYHTFENGQKKRECVAHTQRMKEQRMIQKKKKSFLCIFQNQMELCQNVCWIYCRHQAKRRSREDTTKSAKIQIKNTLNHLALIEIAVCYADCRGKFVVLLDSLSSSSSSL